MIHRRGAPAFSPEAYGGERERRHEQPGEPTDCERAAAGHHESPEAHGRAEAEESRRQRDALQMEAATLKEQASADHDRIDQRDPRPRSAWKHDRGLTRSIESR